MTWRVALTTEAERDLVRLAEFLTRHNESVARRAGAKIKTALRSLDHMPTRARRLSDELHEFDIRFGKSGYVVQFRVAHDVVIIARIFHMREDRSGSDD